MAEEDSRLAGFLTVQGDQADRHFPAVDYYESPVGVNLWAALRKVYIRLTIISYISLIISS